MTERVSATSARRFARRQWSRRLLRVRPVLALLIVGTVVAVAVWAVGISSLLDVRRVEVRGLPPDLAPAESQVRTAAESATGSPLARVDLDAVGQRVLDELPVLKEATARRSWPHTLVIEVAERTPVAVWNDDGTYRLVDDGGVAYRRVTSVADGLPVIHVQARPVEPNRITALRRAAASVVAALPPKLARDVTSVSVETRDSVTLRLARGVTVMWGNAAQSREKARVLEALLRQKAKVYDVSVPGFPTTRA